MKQESRNDKTKERKKKTNAFWYYIPLNWFFIWYLLLLCCEEDSHFLKLLLCDVLPIVFMHDECSSYWSASLSSIRQCCEQPIFSRHSSWITKNYRERSVSSLSNYYSSPLYDFSMIERINHWKQVEELFVKSLSSCRKWTHTQNLVNSVLITFF